MTDRASRLTAFLAEGSALPFVWGERDCTLWVADWIKAERGFDPAAARRGSYATASECWRLLRRAGGLASVVTVALAQASLAETDAPDVGDVGLVETAVGPMMAICTGAAWALKSIDGIAILPIAPVRVWAL
jgi:hypothetical protein